MTYVDARAQGGMRLLLALALGCVVGCGGAGSQSSGLLTALPPASEPPLDSPTSEVAEGVSADLSPFSPSESTPTSTPSPDPEPPLEPTGSTSAQSLNPPRFLSVKAPATTTAGQSLTLRGEISTPAGLKGLELEVTAPLGLGIQLDLTPEELGCSTGAMRCTLQGTVDLPEGIAGRYQLSLVLYDLLDQTDTEVLSIQVTRD